MPRGLLILLSFLSIVSCSRSDFYLLNVEPKDENTLEDGYVRCTDSSYDLDIAFIEDALGYLIFNVELTSYDGDSIFVKTDQFHIDYITSSGDLIRSESLDPSDIEIALNEEKESLTKEKKRRTTFNAILTGLEVLSIALVPGGNTAGVVAYGAESALYIADERNAYKVAELSIEDEIKYLNEQVLHELIIPPYEKVNFDILFSRMVENDHFSIESMVNARVCSYDFSQELVNVR